MHHAQETSEEPSVTSNDAIPVVGNLINAGLGSEELENPDMADRTGGRDGKEPREGAF